MKLFQEFTAQALPECSRVGGKAMSLIYMTMQGLPIPPGFVLSTDFFTDWLDVLLNTPEWDLVLTGGRENLKVHCDALKTLAKNLEMGMVHKQVLAEAMAGFKATGAGLLFAVRSSSPEEDLEGLSFAGGYETVLGVKEQDLEKAICQSFASCLDERVFVYKQQHGLDISQPKIAVIVQEQIASEIAGVGFSLNPLNNCYDEAVINANYGLGESVVAGIASPDTYVIDKVRHTKLESKIGKKEISVWLRADGGVYKEPSGSRERACLSDEQLFALTDLLAKVEANYKKPVDIEWAIAHENFYLLQARPITAYVPLPEKLLTLPGAPKNLYLDMTLTKWGMPKPLTMMGTDFIAAISSAMLRTTMGNISQEAVNLLRPIQGGRAYVNVSTNLKLQSRKRVVDEYRTMDTISAEVIEKLDEAEYVPNVLPPELKGLVFKILCQNTSLVAQLIRGLLHPERVSQDYLESVRRLPTDLVGIASGSTSAKQLLDRMMKRMLEDADLFLAIIFAAEIAKRQIRRLFKNAPPEARLQATYLERGLPNNITIEMGLVMDCLARTQEVGACTSGEEFAAKILGGAFSPEFHRVWDSFITQYGFRCPMELDPGTPRPYENIAQFWEWLKMMALSVSDDNSPQNIYKKSIAVRERSYLALCQLALQSGRRQAKKLEKNYRVLVELGGFREMPKYCAIMIADIFRRRILEISQRLVEAGRMNNTLQAFDLTIAELDRAQSDPTFDVHAVAEENTRFLKKLKYVREFPHLIDSRGKILRPPRKPAKAGELVGEPISPGLVHGPAKVLLSPDEKKLLPGDILVTQTTDPGWTPLFLNAGGIVLEVGGLLQHGALVAREYGKPCVAGIENVTSLLSDGQWIELDGTHGMVRSITADSSQ